MSVSVKRKRSSADPQGSRKPTTVGQLRTYFRHHSLDLAAPCSAAVESAGTTSKASCCWVFENLQVWNSILHPSGVELRESGPSSLTLQTFVGNCNPGTTDYRAVCAFLVVKLINNHQCVQCVYLGYVGELFGCKSLAQLNRLRPNVGIREIALSGRMICEAELNVLVRAVFKGDPTFIMLHQTNFDPLAMTALYKAITTPSRLTEVDLTENGMKSSSTIRLIEALEASTVKSLKLEHNVVGIRGAQRFANFLRRNKTLLELSLFKTKLKDKGAVAIAGALAVNDTLQHLMMGGNSIGPTGANALASSLQVNSSLLKLDLRENNLGTSGAIFLANMLALNRGLHELSLDGNSIGDEGVVAIADALAANTTLRGLSIRASFFDDRGVAALGRLLASNNTLVKLNVTWRPILDDVAQFTEALASNRSLEGVELSVWGCAALEGLSRAVQLNTTLRHLCVRTYAPDLSPFFNCLQVNKSVEVLELHSLLSVADGKAFSLLLKKTTTLRSVTITPRMSNACLVHLVQALSTNTSVWSFTVSTGNVLNNLRDAMVNMLSNNRTLNNFILNKASADEECLEQLANGLESNRSLVQLQITYPTSSAAGYRFRSLLRRNWTLKNLAIQFALHNVPQKEAAEAFQIFRRSGLFYEELSKVAKTSAPLSARYLIKAADQYILRNFVTITGIVKERLVCAKPRGKKHSTTLCQLNAYCLLEIFSYLKVSDIK